MHSGTVFLPIQVSSWIAKAEEDISKLEADARPPSLAQVPAGVVKVIGVANLIILICKDARMETRASPHRARTTATICPHGAVSAIDPTSPGTEAGDLVPPSMVASEEGANSHSSISY